MLMITRSPINRTAARVVAPGQHYVADKTNGCVCQGTPPPYRAPKEHELDLTGMRFGRFTVLGIASETTNRWVVRCNCGNYSLRKPKAIKNPNNVADACEQCRHIIHLKRSELFRRAGVDKPSADFI